MYFLIQILMSCACRCKAWYFLFTSSWFILIFCLHGNYTSYYYYYFRLRFLNYLTICWWSFTSSSIDLTGIFHASSFWDIGVKESQFGLILIITFITLKAGGNSTLEPNWFHRWQPTSTDANQVLLKIVLAFRGSFRWMCTWGICHCRPVYSAADSMRHICRHLPCC